MFEAFSFRLGKPVNATDVTDLKERFGCLNLDCKAEFKLKSLNGKKSVHFAKQRFTQHIPGCPYALDDGDYKDSDSLVKYDLEYIFSNAANRDKSHSSQAKVKGKPKNKSQKKTFVRTPKQLLTFCTSNKLDTPYVAELTVDDIIVDRRNLHKNNRVKGFEGLRLLLGTTTKSKIFINQSSGTIYFKVEKITSNGKRMFLNAKVTVNSKLAQEVQAYISDTFNDFKEHSIAVLGDWIKTCDYKVECKVEKSSNVIYKFADGVK